MHTGQCIFIIITLTVKSCMCNTDSGGVSTASQFKTKNHNVVFGKLVVRICWLRLTAASFISMRPLCWQGGGSVKNMNSHPQHCGCGCRIMIIIHKHEILHYQPCFNFLLIFEDCTLPLWNRCMSFTNYYPKNTVQHRANVDMWAQHTDKCCLFIFYGLWGLNTLPADCLINGEWIIKQS